MATFPGLSPTTIRLSDEDHAVEIRKAEAAEKILAVLEKIAKALDIPRSGGN